MNVHKPLIEVSVVNMTSKGQVLIPKVLRDRIGLRPGEPVSVAINDRGEVVILTLDKARRGSETAEQRRERIRAAVRSIEGKYDFGGGTTDEIMRDLRGDRTP